MGEVAGKGFDVHREACKKPDHDLEFLRQRRSQKTNPIRLRNGKCQTDHRKPDPFLESPRSPAAQLLKITGEVSENTGQGKLFPNHRISPEHDFVLVDGGAKVIPENYALTAPLPLDGVWFGESRGRPEDSEKMPENRTRAVVKGEIPKIEVFAIGLKTELPQATITQQRR